MPEGAVAFQGERGAYSEAAILEHFGEACETLPCPAFEDVFAAVEGGACALGLLPIENSLAGSIHRNYDLLLQNRLHVVGEHVLRVSHCLIARPGVRLEEIRAVASHPQALAQCEGNLRRLGVEMRPAYDTAGSLRLLQESGDRSLAVVASRRAAALYGMQVLAEQMEDNLANYTRFLIVAREAVDPGPDAKTSIVFSLQNRAGVLFKALSVFALRDIDLTKIESRPLVGKPWEYFFYIDLAGSTAQEPVKNALGNLAEFAAYLRVLGSYPRWKPVA